MHEAKDQDDIGFGPARLTSADPAVVFARLEETGLIARGGVNIIGLDTVRDRLAERWPRKRPVVWEHLEALADRQLGPGDLCLRLNDTDFAIAISGEEPIPAQARCLRILRAVLEHFLGACRTDELVIRQVTAIVAGEVQCTPLDPRTIDEGASGSAPAPNVARAKARFNEQPFIMSSMGGRDMILKHEFEALTSLPGRKPVATVLEPSVVDVATGRRIPAYAFGRLSDPDLWSIDQLTLALAAEAAERGYPTPPLLLPLAYQSVSGSKGRARVVELLGTAARGLAVAVTNVEPGTPRGCLAEAVAMLRRMDVTVLIRVSPVRDALAALELAKPHGTMLDLEPLTGHEDRIRQAAATFAPKAQRIGAITALRGSIGELTPAQAAAAGFTHWSTADAADVTLAA